MRIDLRLLLVAALLMSLGTGCRFAVNRYLTTFEATEYPFDTPPRVSDAPVRLIVSSSPTDIQQLTDAGYEQFGSSIFAAPYTSMTDVVDAAREVGASAVVCGIRYKETMKYSDVDYLPVTAVTYSYAPRRRRHGGFWMGVRSHVTTIWDPVIVERNVDIYDHEALFFRRKEAAK